MKPVDFSAATYPGNMLSFDHFSRGRLRWCTAFLCVCTVFSGLLVLCLSLPPVRQPPSSPPPAAMAVSLVALPSIPAPAAQPQPPAPVLKQVLPPPLPALPAPALPLPPIAPSHPQKPKTKQATRPNQTITNSARAPSPPAMAAVKSKPSLSASNTPGISTPDWESLILKKLQSLKHYPAAAQAAGEQGIATVRFTMDRQGHVLSVSLVKSAGSADLDAESIALIQRASPLPVPPPSLAGDMITLTVPVVFFLDQDFLQRKSE